MEAGWDVVEVERRGDEAAARWDVVVVERRDEAVAEGRYEEVEAELGVSVVVGDLESGAAAESLREGMEGGGAVGDWVAEEYNEVAEE